MPLIILSAVRFEAEPSLQVLRSKETEIHYFEIGIGPLSVAWNAHKIQKFCKNRRVLYIGTCGSFYPFEKPHLVCAYTSYWMPSSYRNGSAHMPENLYPPIPLPKSSLSLKKVAVLTSPTISLEDSITPAIAMNLPSRENLVENMELHACAKSLLGAKQLDVILGVTNQVGPEGSKQWALNYKELALMTAEFIGTHY